MAIGEASPAVKDSGLVSYQHTESTEKSNFNEPWMDRVWNDSRDHCVLVAVTSIFSNCIYSSSISTLFSPWLLLGLHSMDISGANFDKIRRIFYQIQTFKVCTVKRKFTVWESLYTTAGLPYVWQ